ncbi:MAG TPA: oxygenase MpaB family protein [Acidimicrobiales bacterium]|nr:oxygenase MpaB family protein [Acidimicrobiales bacterium]
MTDDLGLFGPDSVTWRIHADPSMLIGGIRALLVQALHPLAMAGVAQHSDYQDDPWGRLQRTVDYVVTTTFGDTPTALAAGARVRAVHTRVRGVDAVTGRPYRADDPELLLWVHAVEVHSFLAAYRGYGGLLGDADADRYLAEMVRAAELVGLDPHQVPTTTGDLRSYLRGVSALALTPAARDAMRQVLSPPMPLPLRPFWTVPTTAAVALLPRRARELYGLSWFPPLGTPVRVGTFSLLRLLNLLVPAHPAIRQAQGRARSLAA